MSNNHKKIKWTVNKNELLVFTFTENLHTWFWLIYDHVKLAQLGLKSIIMDYFRLCCDNFYFFEVLSLQRM